MNEYIKFPYWVTSWDDIKSTTLEEFKKEAFLDSNKNIDMNILRSFYKRDKDKFIDLVEELSFRGFEFYNSKPSNLLKNIKLEENLCLLSIEGKTENKIDFNKYLLGNLNQRFSINDPSFFNYVPLDGFKAFNPEINMADLKEDLLKSNFTFLELNKEDQKNEKNQGKILDKEYKLEQKNNREEYYVENQDVKISISEVFFDTAYKSTLNFLVENNIKFIEDITLETINDFVHFRGIGITKVEKFLVKLFETYKQYENSNNFKYDITEINFWFPEIEFDEFREWCSFNSIYKVLDLNENIFETISKENNIANSTVNKIKDKFHLYRALNSIDYSNILQHNKNRNLDIETYFEGRTYLTILNYLKSKGVNTIKDINTSIISDFQYSKGAGINKITLFADKLIEIFLSNYYTTELNFNIYKVDFWFMLDDFKEFRELCKLSNILYVEDITDEIINEAKLFKGINNRKLEKIKDRLLEFNDLEKVEIKKEVIVVPLKEYWFEKIKDIEVKELQKVLELDLEVNISILIKDINEDTINADYNKLISCINSIKSPREIFSILEDVVKKERNIQILDYRYAEGDTLEQIGEKFDLTRERVRQIIKKDVSKIINMIKINNTKNSLILEFGGKNHCSLKDFYNLFSKGKEHYAKVLLESYEQINYFKPLNIVFFSGSNDFEITIERLINTLPKTFNLYEYLDILTDSLKDIGIESPSIEAIENLLESYSYKVYGEYVSKGRLSLLEAFEILFSEYIDEDLKLDEEGFKYLKTLANDILNLDIGDNGRAAEARIRDNRSILLTDRLTFRHMSKIDISSDIISKIKNILDDIFTEADVVNVNYVFTENEELFKAAGILNKIMLYSLIGYYFDDEYKVGKGNTLDIYKDKEIQVLNREDILINIIKENNGSITKNDLVNITNWEDYKVENAISDSNKILKFNENIWLLEDFIISEEEEILLYNLVNDLIKKEGFTTCYIIYKELIFNPKLSNLINVNKIKSPEILITIIKKKFKNLKGNLTFITNENSKHKSIEEFIANKFTNIHYADDIRDFLKSIGYKDMMVSKVVCGIIQKELFVQVSNDQIVNKKAFNIDSNVVEELSKYIEQQFSNKEYLVLSELKGYRNVLPQIEYKWNPYVMKALLNGNGFRVIKRIFSDTRFEKIIIVREDSNIKTYADLIYMIIANEYKGNMNEVRIYDYLSEVGVVRKFDDIYEKNIPYDLKSSGKIKIDELGKVELL